MVVTWDTGISVHRAYSIRNGAYVDSHSMARVIAGPQIGARKR